MPILTSKEMVGFVQVYQAYSSQADCSNCVAGILTCSYYRRPSQDNTSSFRTQEEISVAKDCRNIVIELTVGGTVRDLHPIPF
jgi:hypothetical protein